MSTTGFYLPEEGFRWFGPGDPVSLSHIRQAGASSLFTSLHQIPYGELWSREAIKERKAMIEAAGLRWDVAESLPVHEDIKTGRGDLKTLFANYTQSMRNLAEEGIYTIVYNFMPVLDWIRTEMRHVLPDGAISMRYDPVHFAAFELFALKREGAEGAYDAEMREQARIWWEAMSGAGQDHFIKSIIDVFPGCKWGLSLDDIRAMLARYEGIDAAALRNNMTRFLEAVIPVAEEIGMRFAVHPDDPPFPVLGLPRIVCTAEDVEAVFNMVDSPANGLCFCAGSFSARTDNDLPAMMKRFGPRIHAVHLRSTQLNADGSFFEAGHLSGSANLPSVVRNLLSEQDRRRAEGRTDWRLTFRPDHGHVMMDDLEKPGGVTPGYTGIGRMRGLAELRGLMHGFRAAEVVTG